MDVRWVTERKTRLDGSAVEFACEGLVIVADRRAVLRYVTDREWRIAGTELVVPKATVTIAHYWTDRPYNVYHWVARGRTLGYYCSVADDTSIGEDRVEYLDLAVDVLIDTAGRATVLDEDELPDDLPSPLRAVVSRALEQLTGTTRGLVAEIESQSRHFA